jgi:predicted RNase H-like HicB family nuclease
MSSTRPAFEQYPFQIGLLPEGEGEGYAITFPDLPGCKADGATEADAIANARGAFHAWMSSIIEDRKAIPAPHSAGTKNDPAESEAFTMEQHERNRANIRARGMTVEVFLPESLADWLREKIAAGVYADAKEAAYLAFQDLRELDQHPQVRRELLTAMIKDSLAAPGRTYSPAEVRSELRAMVREYANTEPPSTGSPLPAPRKFSREQIQGWIADDEEGMRRFQSDAGGK